MVLHGGGGDGASAKASTTKTGSAKKQKNQASAALAAGLKEAQKNKTKVDPLDGLDSDEESNPLCAACQSGRANAVRKALSAAGADPNAIGSQGYSPLFTACQDGKAEIVAMLLEANADPALACFGGATPLYVACSKNHADVVKLLVKAGAPVDALANGYYTPMLACVTHGCEDAARTLLTAGADVHLCSEKWGTYLHAAAKNSKSGHYMASLLLGFDADLDAVHDGRTPQELAEEKKNTETISVLKKAVERRAKLAAQRTPPPLDAEPLPLILPENLPAAAPEPAPEPTPEERAAMEVAAEKKRAKKARQKSKAAEAKKAAEEEAEAEEQLQLDTSSASPPPSLAERRADALLAERALATLSVEAAKKERFDSAVEAAAAQLQKEKAKDEASGKLHMLAKKEAVNAAVEGAAAAARKEAAKDEASSKLHRLAARAKLTSRLQDVAAENPEKDGGEVEDAELVDTEALLDDLGLEETSAATSSAPRFFKRVETAAVEEEEASVATEPAIPASALPTGKAPVTTSTTESTAVEKPPPGDEGREDAYVDFCKMLHLKNGITPSTIPMPEMRWEDRMYAVSGAMLMREATVQKEKAENPEEPASPERKLPSSHHFDGSDDELDMEMTLEPGKTRDVSKSPQHHQLQMDNFIPEGDYCDDGSDDEDAPPPRAKKMLALDDDDSDVSEEEGEWLDVGNESTGPTPPKDKPSAAEASPEAAASKPVPKKPEPSLASFEPPSPKLLPMPRTTPPMSPIAGAKKEDAVAPFSLDPSFDYDAPVENTTRFSVARALEEGEYYDRLMQEATSPSKERTMMNPSGAPAASKKSGLPSLEELDRELEEEGPPPVNLS